MSTEWSKALDVQYRLARWWVGGDGLYWAKNQQGIYWDGERDTTRENAEKICVMYHRILTEADTFYVNEQMSTLVEAAAPGFLSGELHPDDVISDCGFAYFENPIHLTGRDGIVANARAIMWGRTMVWAKEKGHDEPGLFVGVYADRDDPQDEWIKKVIAPSVAKTMVPKYLLLHWMGWRFNHHYDYFAPDDEADWSVVPGTLWALCRQKIGVERHETPARSVRRGAEREGVKHVSTVRVVTLRQPLKRENHDDETGFNPVEWSHRWITRGHWRWQWYPTLGRHQRIWIRPHVKGPEDKELVVKRTIFSVTR